MWVSQPCQISGARCKKVLLKKPVKFCLCTTAAYMHKLQRLCNPLHTYCYTSHYSVYLTHHAAQSLWNYAHVQEPTSPVNHRWMLTHPHLTVFGHQPDSFCPSFCQQHLWRYTKPLCISMLWASDWGHMSRAKIIIWCVLLFSKLLWFNWQPLNPKCTSLCHYFSTKVDRPEKHKKAIQY